jgi:hypothetical protein
MFALDDPNMTIKPRQVENNVGYSSSTATVTERASANGLQIFLPSLQK